MIIDENKKKNNTNNKVENESNHSDPDFTIWNLNSLYHQTIRKSRNSNNRITRRKLKNEIDAADVFSYTPSYLPNGYIVAEKITTSRANMILYKITKILSLIYN